MGITLREIIYDIGGGIRGGKKFKAVQTGGPSGGVITADYLDTPIDTNTCRLRAPSWVGGRMIVMTRTTAWSRRRALLPEFCVDESCGKVRAVPHRHAGAVLNLLEKIAEGRGTQGDLDKIRGWAPRSRRPPSAAWADGAEPGAVHHEVFRGRIRAHIDEKRCPAGKCKKLVSYAIDPASASAARCAREVSGEHHRRRTPRTAPDHPGKLHQVRRVPEGLQFGAVSRR
jgi:NADH-quinone oxidoreductase subunit F/NADP-reducing hydrogenase subunit HndC